MNKPPLTTHNNGHTLVIADIHLQPHDHEINRAFLTFLHNEAPKADALYILGDLFEMWVGDDIGLEDYAEVITAFKQLTDQGVAVYLLYGNRDFLMKQAFFQATGIQPLDEVNLIELYGTTYLMLHGDSLCTDDLQYQKMRRWFRKPWIQWLFLKLSRHQRLKIGLSMRQNSRQQSQNKPMQIMDVNSQAVDKLFEQYPTTHHMLHGHTHRPAHHHANHNGQGTHRWVLGDWRLEKKAAVAGEVIKIDYQGPELIDYRKL